MCRELFRDVQETIHECSGDRLGRCIGNVPERRQMPSFADSHPCQGGVCCYEDSVYSEFHKQEGMSA